jgi:hypothetical protein
VTVFLSRVYKGLGEGWFSKGKQLDWLKKLRLLLVSLTIQGSSKVNISDNNFNSTAQFTSQLRKRKGRAETLPLN